MLKPEGSKTGESLWFVIVDIGSSNRPQKLSHRVKYNIYYKF